MATPEGVSRITAADLVQPLADLYADLETRLAADIARRLAAGQEAPEWAQNKLAAVAELRRFVRALLERAARDTEDRLLQALLLAYERGGNQALRDVAALSSTLPAWLDLAGIDNPGPRIREALASRRAERDRKLALISRAFPGVGNVMRMVRSLALRINGTFLPVLRWAEDSYREVIARTALPDVLHGVATRLQASQRAWDEMLNNGVTGFVDKSGRAWNLASYVEMATRTGVVQASVEGHLDRLADAGIDLVIVPNAPQECEKCRPWEGKVLSRTGAFGPRTIMVQSAISDEMVEVHIAGTVAEAILAGLFHPNCRHVISAFLPGVTRIPKHTEDPEGDAARQRLRHLERQVRKEKLRAEAAIDPAAGRQHAAKAPAWQAKIREHVAATKHLGIVRKPVRERINTAR